jgi:hypothetical protein
MAVRSDNLDDFIKQFAKMDKAVGLEVIRESRKKMRAVMRSLKPLAKRSSPKDTGQLAKSIKVQSRSRRGVSTAKLVWMVPYAGPLNFKKGQSAEKYATDLWDQEVDRLDSIGANLVKETFKEVLEKHGVKVKNT